MTQPDGPALFVDYTLLPKQRTSWFVAGVSRPDASVVLCRDVEVPFPSTQVLEIRSGALWSHAICEEPLQRWTVALEAFALAMENPYEAWTNEIGDRIGIACDLEWEAVSAPSLNEPTGPTSLVVGYSIAAKVHGELQVGDDRWELDGTGRWLHQWGVITDSWFKEMRCSQVAADKVSVCWTIDGPQGSINAIRHVLADGWCRGTE
jgi:hypothetical protein